MVVPLIVFFAFQRHFVSGARAGAVKSAVKSAVK
jgi:ABC-type glycerol-3-phosphate transport system permease component